MNAGEISDSAHRRACDFIENEGQFHLGFLPTEQSNPITATLEEDFKRSTLAGVQCLQRADRQIPIALRHSFASRQFRSLVDDIVASVTSEKGRIVFSGCGATGRLSILLESMWRDFFHRRAAELTDEERRLADRSASIMTGGDFALIRSVEFFEDFAEGGRRQAEALRIGEGDTFVAITEGGETSSVLGTLAFAAEHGAKCYLVFNNPADLLRARLVRSRAAIGLGQARCNDQLKNNGLVQPPTVRKLATGKYELIAGERRLRAAQIAGWTKIRVTLVEADDQTAAVMTTTENLQREDLNPIEEAVSYKTLQDKFNLTQQEVAEKVGKGRATVANATRLLELPEEVKQLLSASLLSVGHAKVLLSVDDEKERVLLARDCVNEQLTVRALEKKVARIHSPVEVRQKGEPDLPDSYVRNLSEKMKRHLGCAVRVTSGVTHQNGRHTKGVVEIDFFNNDDLDRIIRMLGVSVD